MIAAIAIVACGPPSAGRTPEPATPPATPTTPPTERLPPSVDLTGGWTTGSENEPPAGPVVRYPSCAYNPAVWLIDQAGDALKAWLFPESFNQGIVRAGPGPSKIAHANGTISGADVVIDDGQDRMVLRYDSTSGHLRGTRNGAAFWAARQNIVRMEACPGIP